MILPQILFGYRQGLRQPAAPITLTYSCPADFDVAAVDAVMEKSFGVQPVTGPEPATPAHALAWRILLIARSLQQAARIPVFEPGRVLGVRPHPDAPAQWQADAIVPRIDLLPPRATTIAYGSAIDLASWIVQHLSTPADMEAFCIKLEKTVLNPLRAMAATGISTVPILEAAHAEGIPFRHVGGGIFQLGWGRQAHLMDRSASDRDSAIGSRLAQSKHRTAQLLHAAGLPTPEHVVVVDRESARRAAARLGWPLVVKPDNRDRSEGVTIGIRDMPKLLAGFDAAAALSKTVLVEREVPGICYRLLIANGGFLYAIRRRPKSVTGDGLHTVGELIRRGLDEARQRAPWIRPKTVGLDALAMECLAAQGLTAASVPQAGAFVALRPIESSEWGGTIDDATDAVHPDNAEIAVRAARLLGLTQAGVDMITVDISMPWHRCPTIINEVNYAPYLGGNPTAKAKLPEFLKRLVGHDERIPVEAFVGGESAMVAGLARQQDRIAAGVHCYLTSHRETLDGRGSSMRLARDGLFNRSLALLLDRDVESLILVIQTDELAHSGVPVDRIDRIDACDGDLANWRDGAPLADGPARKQALLGELRAWQAR